MRRWWKGGRSASFRRGRSTLLNGLVSWYSLAESSGARADSHGGNHLTDAGNNIVGVAGHGADFEANNATSALYISNAAQVGLGFLGTFFASFFIEAESRPATDSYFNFFDKDAGPDLRGFYSAFRDQAGTYQVMMMVANAAGTSSAAVNWNYNLGQRYHLLIAYDAAAGTMALYVDNVLVGTGSGLRNSIRATANPFYVGAVNGGAGQKFDGIISKMGFWAGRLPTATERALLASGASYPFA